jgi:serine/threonine protein kinase
MLAITALFDSFDHHCAWWESSPVVEQYNLPSMPLVKGTRLGPYEIAVLLGAGGMGEVYSARDTRLERIVAIKILPLHRSDQADARERFEREARAIASLNHPHICQLYDVGIQDTIDYLVLEYLEGFTGPPYCCLAGFARL